MVKKISELDSELRVAKDHLRKVNNKKREDERELKTQHDHLMKIEEQCRKMASVIKEKKKKRTDIRGQIAKADDQPDEKMNMEPLGKVYT